MLTQPVPGGEVLDNPSTESEYKLCWNGLHLPVARQETAYQLCIILQKKRPTNQRTGLWRHANMRQIVIRWLQDIAHIAEFISKAHLQLVILWKTDSKGRFRLVAQGRYNEQKTILENRSLF